LLDQFYQHPYILTGEVESFNSQIVTALHKMKDVFVILMSCFTDNQIEFPGLSRIEIRIKQVFDETQSNFSKYDKDRLKKVFITDRTQKESGNE
jgi:tRNA uridine 5-carbamoylmethylation protein Kti12